MRVAAHALGEVLVRRADNHAVDTRITRRRRRRGGERIVRLELHHRPDDDAGRREGLFEQRELRQQVRFDACAGLVAWPQPVAKRLDDVIGRNSDVRGAAADHAQHRRDDASDRGDLAAVPIPCGRQRVVVPEQLVCAVDQIDVQVRSSTDNQYRDWPYKNEIA